MGEWFNLINYIFDSFSSVLSSVLTELLIVFWFLFIFIIPSAALVLFIYCIFKHKNKKQLIIGVSLLTAALELLSFIIIWWSFFVEFEKDLFYFIVVFFVGGLCLLKFAILLLPVIVLLSVLFRRKARKD